MEEESTVTWAGVAVVVALVVAVVAMVALRPERGAQSLTAIERIRRQGSVRIAFANEAPYGYLDTDTGRVTGEAPEIARAVFARMGIAHVEAVSTDFGALIPGLIAGRFDVIAAGMYVTPERCREIAFSNPTYRIGEAFVVASGNPSALHGFDDVLARPGVKLGVVAGAVELAYARRLGIPDPQLVLYGDNVSALDGVRTGHVDAFACTTLTALSLLRRAADTRLELARPMRQPVVDGVEQVGYGAFGVRRADAGLRRALNEQLAQFIGSAEHLELVRPFGFAAATLPGNVTASELCGAAG
jgi:polar amino acid transport system substrate-binding protein